MIIFKTVRYKNLLSTGNEFTEIDLHRKKTTLIVGRNGAGKSTFLDALSYCLYNKAFRNINKPQLMNSITGKNLLVEVEFNIGGREYLVRRGQRPNVFEIYQDGKLLNQVADNRDYQGMLENNILRMNHRSFRQIVVLGSANFIPFMQLPAHARREVIEDLLDIQVFSVMNTLLKNKIAANKEAIIENQHQVDLNENLMQMHNKHLQEMKQNNDELIQDKIEKIAQYEAEVEELFKEIELKNRQIADIESQTESKDWNEKSLEARTLRAKIETSIQSLTKKINFYTTETSCPTCKQDISEEFKATVLSNSNAKLAKSKSGLDDLDARLAKIQEKLNKQKETNDKIHSLNQLVSELNAKINSNNRIIGSFQKEIEETKARAKVLAKNMAGPTQSYAERVHELHIEAEKLRNDRETLGVAASLLKDGGIKALIIKQYIPVMNKLINKYLQMMEFYVDFQLDESFKESIHSRGRDDFSYDSFSQGEKMRIDLSILFAWRAIAKMRNSASTNLLIFDEIFDSSLDGQGTDEFLKILQSLTSDTNTFIISHKVDSIVDKFETVIKFEKNKNFSRIAA